MARLYILGAIVLLLMSAAGAYSASMGVSIKSLGAGSVVPVHLPDAGCEIGKIEPKTPPTVTLVKADQVYCDTTGTYLFEVTVVAGAVTGTGSTNLAVVADVKARPLINISPSVDISSGNFTITLTATLQ